MSGWHLGFNLSKGNFTCWRCGSLRFWEVMGALLHIRDHEEVRRKVAAYQKEGERTARITREREKTIDPPERMAPMAEIHREYLIGRNFDPDYLESKYQVRGTGPISGEWSWRIVFPILSRDDQIVAYQGRCIGDARPRYKLTEERFCLEDPKALLYGIHACNGDSVVVVEGATALWRLGDGAVATLGIKWNVQQANRLRRFKRRFVLYDPDPDGETGSQKKAQEIAYHLSQFPGETELLSDFDCQPGEFSNDFALNLMKELGVQ